MIENKLYKWSRNDEQFLISNYKKMSSKELSKRLGIKQKSVENKLFQLHLKREKTRRWSQDDEQFLISNYKNMSNKELSRALGINQKSVANKLFNLHLRREKTRREKTHIEHVSTPVEGKYANLKGMLFGLICENYIKQKYSGMLILSSYRDAREKTRGSSNATSIGFVCEDTKTLRRMVKVFPHLKRTEGFGKRIGFNQYFNPYQVYPICDLHSICDFSDDIPRSERKVLTEILKEEEEKKKMRGTKILKDEEEKEKRRGIRGLKITDFM